MPYVREVCDVIRSCFVFRKRALTYMFVNATAGSFTMISIGLMMASQNTSEAFNFSCSISLLDLMFVAPVNLRKRCALRLKILSAASNTLVITQFRSLGRGVVLGVDHKTSQNRKRNFLPTLT